MQERLLKREIFEFLGSTKDLDYLLDLIPKTEVFEFELQKMREEGLKVAELGLFPLPPFPSDYDHFSPPDDDEHDDDET